MIPLQVDNYSTAIINTFNYSFVYLNFQFFVLWCFIYSSSLAKSLKREVSTPELVRGGFAASSGPYGNEASASTLNYQTGNQGNYNNVDSNNVYSDYRNYNGQSLNIPVQEQGDVQPQNIRVPVWSPPAPSQNPYTAPPQASPYPAPQAELIHVPIQQALQVPYQPESQVPQQQSYISQQGYSEQAPQQFENSVSPGVSSSYQSNGPAYSEVPSSINEQTQYNAAPAPQNDYNAGISSQLNVPSTVSSAANIAASYNSLLSSPHISSAPNDSPIPSGSSLSLPSLYQKRLPSFSRGPSPSISSGTPSRFIGKSLRGGSPAVTSSLGGGYHSLEEVLSGGINNFGSSNFGSGFGGFGHGGFGLGGFGSNYFGNLGGFNSFGGFGSNSFPSSLTFGGLKGNLGSSIGSSSKFANFESSPSSLANSIPTDSQIHSNANIPGHSTSQSIPQTYQNNAIADSSSAIPQQSYRSNQYTANEPIQAQPTKN